MEELASLGYQIYITQPRAKKTKLISWEKWKDGLGLKDRTRLVMSEEEKKDELQKAFESAERVRKAFAKK